jgi:hypothetical protein
MGAGLQKGVIGLCWTLGDSSPKEGKLELPDQMGSQAGAWEPECSAGAAWEPGKNDPVAFSGLISMPSSAGLTIRHSGTVLAGIRKYAAVDSG